MANSTHFVLVTEWCFAVGSGVRVGARHLDPPSSARVKMSGLLF